MLVKQIDMQATNTVAALLLSGQRGLIPSALQQLQVKDRDSLEVALNMACAAVLDGELDRATKLLQLAETKGNEILIEENASQAVCICISRSASLVELLTSISMLSDLLLAI